MSRQPSYPKDASVGDEKTAAETEGAGASPEEGSNRTRQLVTGAAIGIGSAALVAALLYAKRRKTDR